MPTQDSTSAPDTSASDEVAAVLARSRAAQAAIADWDQERVDELVTAIGWAIVRKDHAEALAQLAVDEGGFGTYADKLTKIQRRVNGLLADMRGMRTVGVVEEDPERGLVKIAKPVGVVATAADADAPERSAPSRYTARRTSAVTATTATLRRVPARRFTEIVMALRR